TRTIEDHGVTVAQFVPSLLRLVVDQAAPALSCDYLFAGGEALDPSLVERARACARRGFANLYGPTEATIDATHWRCPPGPVPALIPIGRPIANTQAYVLDERREPVPVGVPGEL